MSETRHILLSTCALLLVLAGAGSAAPGDITLKSIYVPPNASRITDVWGYSAGGRDYAVVGDQFVGLWVVDVTDPVAPSLAKDLTGMGFAGFDVKVWDHYIYACNGSANGPTSRVINVSDLANPFVSAPFGGTHNFAIDPAGYLIAELFGVRIYDIRTTPMLPVQIWSDGSGDAHDASVVGDRLYDFRGIFGTNIWDITSRTSPVLLGNIIDPTKAYNHSGYPTEDATHLYICDEKAKLLTPDVNIWNITDPGSAVKVGSFGDPTATVHNLYVVGDLAFVSYYTAGFRVYDVSDPATPVLADEYDTTVQTGDGFGGCFGVYPFAPSGLVYATDGDNGLFIFSVDRGTPVPVAFTAFDARAKGDGAALSWQVFADEPFSGFIVYRARGDRSAFAIEELGPMERNHFDGNVEPGGRYHYTIAAIRDDGSEVLSQTVSVDVPVAAARLHQNHPNPFNPSTTIAFELGTAGPVRIDVFDARGRHVRTLVDAFRSPGRSAVDWDGTSRSGRAVASGLYFYRLRADNVTLTRRMVLLK